MKYGKVIKKCEFCKKRFELKRNKGRKRVFCSLKCYYDSLKFGWRSKRKEALKRAKNKCEKCCSIEKLDIHHNEKAIYKKGHSPSKGSNNDLDNLIVLCKSCHKKEHSKGIKRFSEKGKCIACGKEFKYYSKSNRGKYCSRKCAYKNPLLKLVLSKYNCIKCGVNFKSLRKSKFCSNNCKSRWHYANKRRKE